jgi:DNA-binding response OmpR family regulator
MRILLIEDDPVVSVLIRSALVAQHYYVDLARDGVEGLELAYTNDYDLVVLDIMLPRKNGREVCRELRAEGITVPILMLTSLETANDIIGGLDAGADDYLTKPCDLGVLLAHVRSLTRRNSQQKTTEIQVDDLLLDTAARTVVRGGKPIDLTAKEFALLEYFALNQGRVLTRDMISQAVWDMNFDAQSNVVESLVRFLRRKIDKGFPNKLIHTVRGMGYKFSDLD